MERTEIESCDSRIVKMKRNTYSDLPHAHKRLRVTKAKRPAQSTVVLADIERITESDKLVLCLMTNGSRNNKNLKTGIIIRGVKFLEPH